MGKLAPDLSRTDSPGRNGAPHWVTQSISPCTEILNLLMSTKRLECHVPSVGIEV